MDWKTASAFYAKRLEDAIAVRRYASQLAQLPQVRALDGTTEIEHTLSDEGAQAERQKKRLDKSEFRIAVVGLEKAGKSTFVNAWLGCDLLPAKSQRCTFTTTQIYSVPDETSQRLEVDPKSHQQFGRLCRELEAAKVGADKSQAAKAETDLNTIRKNVNTLKSVLEASPPRKSFINLDDIKSDLRKYVADECYAHAIQEARLFTSRLAEAEGIVFYDVPGLDSGLAKHIEESRDMLTDCDAVILIQRYPSLRGHEKDLIKFAREGDKHIGLEEKLFVFFGRMDSFNSRESFEKDFNAVLQEWRQETNLAQERIIGGSAGAHLVLHGVADQETIEYVGLPEDVTAKLNRILNTQHDLNHLKNLTGIDEIKQRINAYLNTERVLILERRCNAMISNIYQQSSELYRQVSARYPEDPEEARKQFESDRRLEFTLWFNGKKQQIRAAMHNHFEQVKHQLKANSLQTFQGRYEQVICDKIKHLPYRQAQQRDMLFGSCSNPVFDPTKANFAWREHLYADVRKLIGSIAQQLALELTQEARTFVSFMTQQLWGSSFVEQQIVGDFKSFEDRLRSSLKALFLRFVRPVAEALIRGPLDTELRRALIGALERDIDTMDIYFPESGEEIYRIFKRYLRYGVRLLTDEPTIKKELQNKEPPAALMKALQEASGQVAGSTSDLQLKRDLIQQVESDILALEYYLLHSLFVASGFQAFCVQEMENLRDQFYEMEEKDVWNHIAAEEFSRGNPLLLKELPPHIRPQELQTVVSDHLRQLGISLRHFQQNNPGV